MKKILIALSILAAAAVLYFTVFSSEKNEINVLVFSKKGVPVDYRRAYAEVMPEENRFTQVTFAQNLNEPMELDFLTDDQIIFVERRGGVHQYNTTTGERKQLARLPVHSEHEDGLLGVAVDPAYADGHLFISVGDDTNPRESDGFSPTDERADRSPWDAQKSAANTHDLRGKILRIKPEADGSFSIPEDNLFPADGSGGRPEVYPTGSRNPFRISIDDRTGYLHWGEVGPDATHG